LSLVTNEELLPSPEAEAILRSSGWSPDQHRDISEWVGTLRREGNEVPPIAEDILRTYGGLRLAHRGFGGASCHDIAVDPSLWYGAREMVADVEDAIGNSVCPLGETFGASMLGILGDGSVISSQDGDVVRIGENWRSALDRLVLGRGEGVQLAKAYERLP
jgi:hypothetical protein